MLLERFAKGNEPFLERFFRRFLEGEEEYP